MEGRISRLEGKPPLTLQEVAGLQNIDSTIKNIMLTVEEQIKTGKMVDLFSVEMDKMKKERHYWKRVLNLTYGKGDHSVQWKYYELHEDGNINFPRVELKTNI